MSNEWIEIAAENTVGDAIKRTQGRLKRPEDRPERAKRSGMAFERSGVMDVDAARERAAGAWE